VRTVYVLMIADAIPARNG